MRSGTVGLLARRLDIAFDDRQKEVRRWTLFVGAGAVRLGFPSPGARNAGRSDDRIHCAAAMPGTMATRHTNSITGTKSCVWSYGSLARRLLRRPAAKIGRLAVRQGFEPWVGL
jgi:hypothetical protein